MLLYAHAMSLIHFVLAMVLWSLGVALISGTSQAWFVDELSVQGKDEARKIVIPIVQTLALIVGAAAALASTWLVMKSIVWPLRVGGWTSIITGISILFLLRENYGEKSRSIKEALWKNAKDFMQHPFLRMVLLKSASGGIMFRIFVLSWQLYMIQALRLPESFLGAALTMMVLSLAGGNTLATILMRRIHPIKVSVIGLVGVTMGLLMIGIWPNIWAFAAGVVLLELGLGIEQGAFYVWVHDFIPNKQRASFISAISSVESLMGFMVPIFAGLFIENVGFQPTWFFAALSAGLTAGLVMAIANMKSKEEMFRNNI